MPNLPAARAWYHRVARLAVLLLSFAACDGGGAGGDAHLDRLPRLVAEPGMRIGDSEDPTIGFTRLYGLEVDHEGNLYVLEGAVPEIRVYDPAGKLLRRIGRRGGGPGEFENGPTFGLVGDTLWTVDVAAQRITLFDRLGRVLSTGSAEGVPVPLPASYGFVTPRAMRADGKFTSHFGRIVYNRDGAATGVRPTDRIPVPLLLFDASGAVTDTIGWTGRPPPRMWRPPSEDDSEFQMIEVGGRPRMVPTPPTTMPWWMSVMDGYVAVETPLAAAEGDAVFTVTRFGLSEDTVYSRAIHYTPERYSAAELDSIAARGARGASGGMVPIAMEGGGTRPPPDDWQPVARRLRAAMKFPDFKLPVEYPWVAQDESVWLRLVGDAPEGDPWVLLDAEGDVRGELRLPPRTRPLWSRGDVLWAADFDEDDVPWLVRYTIERGR